jgi:hypothetical protein
VLDIPENIPLRVLDIKPLRQALVEYNSHSFDVFDIQHPESGQPVKLYFNIDLPKGWLESHSDAEPGQVDHEE